jgi:hypothetical protein
MTQKVPVTIVNSILMWLRAMQYISPLVEMSELQLKNVLLNKRHTILEYTHQKRYRCKDVTAFQKSDKAATAFQCSNPEQV